MKGAVACLVTLAAVQAVVGAQSQPVAESHPLQGASVRPAPADVDLLGIRNIFRYADDPVAVPPPSGSVRPFQEIEAVATPPPERQGPRLVGLVERSGRLVAALSVEGEVILLDEGQSARGYTVLEIRGETVRLEGPSGDVQSLQLP